MINLLGLHAHIGSQIFEAEGFAVAARTMLAVIAEAKARYDVVLPELDLGGGYGIAYTQADDPSTPQQIADELAVVVGQAAEELGLQVPRISIEPGRAIAGPSTFTLYETGVRKDVSVDLPEGGTATRRYISVNGG